MVAADTGLDVEGIKMYYSKYSEFFPPPGPFVNERNDRCPRHTRRFTSLLFFPILSEIILMKYRIIAVATLSLSLSLPDSFYRE